MEVIATNLAQPTTVEWRGKSITTGIFKKPVKGPIHLQKEIVEADTIADRAVHGGVDKACYLFATEQYDYWKEFYPDLDWDWGMFGENLSISGLDEDRVHIGDVYKIGTAEVEVSQPREPCFKLGIRFGNQAVLKQFIDRAYPGTYVRILREGAVRPGDKLILLKKGNTPISVRGLFRLFYERDKDDKLLAYAINNTALPERKRLKLEKYQ